MDDRSDSVDSFTEQIYIVDQLDKV